MPLGLIFGMFGLILGSFLNVVVLRRGVRSLGGRSGCMSCGAQLAWYDMVPVLSWLVLKGRCRECRTLISIQYPLVEGVTGILFAVIGLWVSAAPYGLSWNGIALVGIYLVLIALLVLISAYDILHTIIPDTWAYSFAALAFVSQFLVPFSGEFELWWFIFAGPIAAAPLFFLWLVSRGAWMGLGDAKLALGIGWLLGPAQGVVAVLFAFVVGAAVTVPLLLFSSPSWKRFLAAFTPTTISRRVAWGFTMKSEIPFGPFLIFSCIIIWFASLYGIDLLAVYARFVGDLLW